MALDGGLADTLSAMALSLRILTGCAGGILPQFGCCFGINDPGFVDSHSVQISRRIWTHDTVENVAHDS